MRDFNWWRSDEAKDARTSQYVAALLFADARNKREVFSSRYTPEWAAIFYYDNGTDTPYWVECKVAVHAKDFARGCHESHINEAAQALAK